MCTLLLLATLSLTPGVSLAFHPKTIGSRRTQHLIRRVPAQIILQGNDFSSLFQEQFKRRFPLGGQAEETVEEAVEEAVEEGTKDKVREYYKDLLGAFKTVDRRVLLLAGISLQPFFFLTASGGFKEGEIKQQEQQQKQEATEKEMPDVMYDPKMVEADYRWDEGYASKLPEVEEAIIELGAYAPQEEVEKLVETLEGRKGVNFPSSALTGRWVMPWVGGWDQVWTSETDSIPLGGPRTISFRRNGTRYIQMAARRFVYGPGVGGMTVEFLYRADDRKEGQYDLLLTRAAVINNEGGAVHTLDFVDGFKEFEVRQELGRTVSSRGTFEKDVLVSDEPIPAGPEKEFPVTNIKLTTTYLSPELWIIRNKAYNNSVSVFRRTNLQAVVDRRGLVIDKQVKPPADDSIRYGGLLFADTEQDYADWDKKVLENEKLKEKLMS